MLTCGQLGALWGRFAAARQFLPVRHRQVLGAHENARAGAAQGLKLQLIER